MAKAKLNDAGEKMKYAVVKDAKGKVKIVPENAPHLKGAKTQTITIPAQKSKKPNKATSAKKAKPAKKDVKSLDKKLQAEVVNVSEQSHKKINKFLVFWLVVGSSAIIATSIVTPALIIHNKNKEGNQVPADFSTKAELDSYLHTSGNVVIVPGTATTNSGALITMEELNNLQTATQGNTWADLTPSSKDSLGIARMEFNKKPANVSFKYQVRMKAQAGAGERQGYTLRVKAQIPVPSTTKNLLEAAPTIDSDVKEFDLISKDTYPIETGPTTQAQLNALLGRLTIETTSTKNDTQLDSTAPSNVFDATTIQWLGITSNYSSLTIPSDVTLEFTLVKKSNQTIGTPYSYDLSVTGRTTEGVTNSETSTKVVSITTVNKHHTSQVDLDAFVSSLEFETPTNKSINELRALAATNEEFNAQAIATLGLVGDISNKPTDLELTYSFTIGEGAAVGEKQSFTLTIVGKVVGSDIYPDRVSASKNFEVLSSNVVTEYEKYIDNEIRNFYAALKQPVDAPFYMETIIGTLPSDTIHTNHRVVFTPTYAPLPVNKVKVSYETAAIDKTQVNLYVSFTSGNDNNADGIIDEDADKVTVVKTIVIKYRKLIQKEANLLVDQALAAVVNKKSSLNWAQLTRTTSDKTRYTTDLGIDAIAEFEPITGIQFVIYDNHSVTSYTKRVSVELIMPDSTYTGDSLRQSFILSSNDKQTLDLQLQLDRFKDNATGLEIINDSYKDTVITTLPTASSNWVSSTTELFTPRFTVNNSSITALYKVNSVSNGSSASITLKLTSTDIVEQSLEYTFTVVYYKIVVTNANAKVNAAKEALNLLNNTYSTRNWSTMTHGSADKDTYTNILGVPASPALEALEGITFTIINAPTTHAKLIEATITMADSDIAVKSVVFTLKARDKNELEVQLEEAKFDDVHGITNNLHTDLLLGQLPSVNETNREAIFGITYLKEYSNVSIEYKVLSTNGTDGASVEVTFTSLEGNTVPVTSTKTIAIDYEGIRNAGAAADRKVDAAKAILVDLISNNTFASEGLQNGSTSTLVDYEQKLGLTRISELHLLTGISFTVTGNVMGETYTKNVSYVITMDGTSYTGSQLTGSFRLSANDKNTLDVNDEITRFESHVTTGGAYTEYNLDQIPTVGQKGSDYSTLFTISTPYVPRNRVTVSYEVTASDPIAASATIVTTFISVRDITTGTPAAPAVIKRHTLVVTYDKVLSEGSSNAIVNSAIAALKDQVSSNNWASFSNMTSADMNSYNLLGLNDASNNAIQYLTDISFTIASSADTYTKSITAVMVANGYTGPAANLTVRFTLTAKDKNELDINDEKKAFFSALSGSTDDVSSFVEERIGVIPEVGAYTTYTNLFTPQSAYTPGTKANVSYVVSNTYDANASIEITFVSTVDANVSIVFNLSVNYKQIQDALTTSANQRVAAAHAVLVDMTSSKNWEADEFVSNEGTADELNYAEALGIPIMSEIDALTGITFVVAENNNNISYSKIVNYTIVEPYADSQVVTLTGSFILFASNKNELDAQGKANTIDNIVSKNELNILSKAKSFKTVSNASDYPLIIKKENE